MADVQWGSETQPHERRSRVPKWVWWVGGGCAVALLVVVIAIVAGVAYLKENFDPDVQWPKVAAVLPMTERPSGWRVDRIPIPFSDDLEMWQFTPEDRDLAVMMMRVGPAQAEKYRAGLFHAGGEPTASTVLGEIGRHDEQRGVLEVQGRELVYVRYRTTPKESAEGDGGFLASWRSAVQRSELVLDATPEGSSDLIALIFSAPRSTEPVPESAVREFLAPFRLGSAAGLEGRDVELEETDASTR